MQSSRTNDKKKTIRKSLCGACLCADRKLSEMLDFWDIFKLICKNVVKDIDSKTLVCFECLALLRNVKRFQEKVLKSQIILNNCINDYFEKNQSNGLSNLSASEAEVLDLSESINNEEFNLNNDDQKNIIDIIHGTSIKQEHIEHETYDFNIDCEPLEEEIKTESPMETGTKEERPIETEINTKEQNINNASQYFTGQQVIKEEKDAINEQNIQNECQLNTQTGVKMKIKINKTKRERRFILIRPRSEMYKFIEINNSAAYKLIEIPHEEIKYWMNKERDSTIFKNALYKCEKCALTIGRKKLEEHARRHSNPRKLICDYCTLSFAKRRHLVRHIEKHRHIRCCETCGFKGIGRDHMYKHAYKEHGRRRQNVQCLTCNTLLKSAREFYKHYRNEHYQGKYICDYCNKKFTSRMKLEKHIFNLHTDHKCKTCGITCKTPYLLKRHVELKHTIERSEATYCVKCDKQFDNVRAFKYHMSVALPHLSERKASASKKCHPCPEPSCPNVYSKNYNMRVHYIKCHTNDSKFQCLECNKRFLTNSKLRNHTKYQHEGCERERKHPCTICGRGFTTPSVLKKHIRTHTGERPYECPHCEAKFTQRTAMVTHMRNIHKD